MTPLTSSLRAPVRRLLATLATITLAGSLLLPLASPASAKETVVERSSDAYVCTGYAGCEDAGYSTSGYRNHSGTMYWQMYSGHNCTNYVAYRMVQAGMPNTRPWSGSGNASNWGVALASKVDQTPTVGAIAWWRANVPGAGSAGHVAYVEKVISPNEIVVSEDSWGGDFHWHRYTKSGAWPSGFIHLVDKTVQNTEDPTVQGKPRVGTTLRATKGTWAPRVDASYQWRLDGQPVSGANGRTFTPQPQHRGKRVSVAVTGRREGFTPTTVVATTGRNVRRGRFVLDERPSVSGEPTVGETLSATKGDFTPTPQRQKVQWYADGEPVAGATGWQLTLGQAQEGKHVRARISAASDGYKTRTPRTARTRLVAPPAVEVTTPARLSGAPVVGERLTVDPGSFSPSRADARYTWMRDGRVLDGVRGAGYDLRLADLGHRVSVRVDLVRKGFRTTTQIVAAPNAVRSTPELSVKPVGREHRAVVRLLLGARGVAAPGGEALVRVGRRSETVPITDGHARVVVRRVAAGQRTVRVRYLGTALLLPRSASSPVKVLSGPGDRGARASVGRPSVAGVANERHTAAGRAAS